MSTSAKIKGKREETRHKPLYHSVNIHLQANTTTLLLEQDTDNIGNKLRQKCISNRFACTNTWTDLPSRKDTVQHCPIKCGCIKTSTFPAKLFTISPLSPTILISTEDILATLKGAAGLTACFSSMTRTLRTCGCRFKHVISTTPLNAEGVV